MPKVIIGRSVMTYKRFKRTLGLIYNRFVYEDYTYRASALAFSSLLTIVPFLLVIFYLLTIFPFFTRISILGKNYIVQNFVPESANRVAYYFEGFIHQANRLPTINIIFLFISITILVYTIEETLSDIWKVPNRSKVNYIFVIYWLIFLFLPFIIGAGVYIAGRFLSLSWVSSTAQWLGITRVIIFLLPLIINTIMFSLLYKFIPNTRIRIRDSLFGGFVAAALFEIGRISFAYYLTHFPSYALIYGAFAIFPIFLVWLYIFWMIILLSGLLTYALCHPK